MLGKSTLLPDSSSNYHIGGHILKQSGVISITNPPGFASEGGEAPASRGGAIVAFASAAEQADARGNGKAPIPGNNVIVFKG